MKESDVAANLKQQLINSAGWASDDVQKARTDALNYYLQRARGDEISGRSTVVAGDLSASVEANLAQMVAAFTTDNIAAYDALGEDDEDQAALESDTVVHFVMKTQNGFVEIASAIKGALLQRNGIMKCWVDEFTQTRTRTFDNVSEEVALQVAGTADAKVLSYDGTKLRVRQTKTHKKFRAEAVDPGNFFVPVAWDSIDLQEVPFCAERHLTTRSDLLRMGYNKKIVAELPIYAGTDGRPDVSARDPGGVAAQPAKVADSSQDQIEWYEVYALLDVDGDGISERRRIAYCHKGSTIIDDEPADLVPYAAGVVMLMPHRFIGVSQYDKLRQTQDEHTGLKRALYDNINAVNKSRIVYLDGKVNPDDVSDGRVNGGLRVSSESGIEDVRTAVAALQVPDNSANVLANIEALKRERAELGGAALDMAAGNMQIGGDRMGSQGLDRAYSVMEELAALMARTFAATLLRNLFLLAHATLRLNFDQPVSIKRSGRWQTPIPSEWQPRDRVTVRIGMSPGERARQSAALQYMIGLQMQLAQLGMEDILIDAEVFHTTVMAWARLNDVQNPERHLLDPQTPNSQKAMLDKAKAAQDSQRKREALMTQAVGQEQLGLAIDKYKADQKTEFDYWAKVLDSEIAEAQIVGTATTDLLKAQALPNDDAKDSGRTNSDQSSAARTPSGAETAED